MNGVTMKINHEDVPCQLHNPKLYTPCRSTQTLPRLSLLSEWHTFACPFI